MLTLGIMLENGLKSFLAGNVDNSLEWYQRANKAWPRDSRALFGLGAVYDVMGDGLKAEQYYFKAITEEPFNREYHTRLICCLIDQERFEEAMGAWDMALDLLRDPELRIDPELYEDLHSEVALCLLHAQRLGEARTVLLSVPTNIKQGTVLTMFKAYAELDLINREINQGFCTNQRIACFNELPEMTMDPARYIAAGLFPVG